MDFRIDVYHHFDGTVSDPIDQILTQLTSLGVTMSALSDAVDAALAREGDENAANAAALAAKDAVISTLQGQVSDLGGQLTTAQANDAADAQTIADTQAALAAQAADVQAQIDRINTLDAAVVPPVPAGDGTVPPTP